MKNCSDNPENCLLKRMVYDHKFNSITTKLNDVLKPQKKKNLFLFTNSNYIHSPSGGQIFMTIIYTIQFITI